MRMSRRWGLVGAVAALTIVAAACSSGDGGGGSGGGDPASTGASGASGSLAISGSSTVQPISSLVAEVFNETNPDVSISVDGPGTGDGFVLFCKGQTDISDASRQIEPEEAKACKDAGIDYVELEIAFDGITVMTNPQNASVSCLTKGDLYALFGPESNGFDRWSDANALAQDVGGNGNLPDEPLEITAPGEESGTYDAFIDLAGIEDQALADGVAEDQAAALRTDYQASPDDNVIIQAMEGSPSSLGFVGFAYAQEAGDQIKEIQIDGGDGCVAPSAETISDGTYPLSRSLYIYVSKQALADNPAVKPFVDFYLSDDTLVGSDGIVGQVGYVPLPQDRIDATRQTWQAEAAS
jgi:phosphate transport system substrate-binding protein